MTQKTKKQVHFSDCEKDEQCPENQATHGPRPARRRPRPAGSRRRTGQLPEVMMTDSRRTALQSDFGTLQRVIVKHVRDAFVDSKAIDSQWRELNYLGPPDLETAIAEYDRLLELLTDRGIRLEFMPPEATVGMAYHCC